MRRMDRYNDEDRQNYSRSNKNQELYENIGKNTRYTNFTDVTNANAYDMTNNNTNTREGYHKMREYDDTFDNRPKERKELDDFNKFYKLDEHKVYDINSVLETARKNRQIKDDLEAKRNLKNTNYNILASLNPEEMEKYREEKQERIKKDQEAELKNIIDKTMAGEIDQETTIDLLSDLMATNVMDAVEKPVKEEKEEVNMDDLDPVDKLMLQAQKKEQEKEDEVPNTKEEQEETVVEKEEPSKENLQVSKEILSKEQLEEVQKLKEKNLEEKKGLMKNADEDFYTRSMDLSDEDFMSDDFKEKTLPIWVKILIFILIIGIAAAAGFFIYQNM